MTFKRRPDILLAGLFALSMSACTNETGPIPAYAGIAPDETVYFAGNEPFWSGETAGDTLRYATPEKPDGSVIEISRFAGNSGISISGVLDGAAFDMVVTQAVCNDTMADRTYPFVVTLSLGSEVREGCAWTDAKPYSPRTYP